MYIAEEVFEYGNINAVVAAKQEQNDSWQQMYWDTK